MSRIVKDLDFNDSVNIFTNFGPQNEPYAGNKPRRQLNLNKFIIKSKKKQKSSNIIKLEN